MAARPKLTYRRETRLLALLVFGEPLEAACRCINVSSTAVRKRMDRDPAFASRVRVARAHRRPDPAAEADYLTRWAVSMPWDD